MFDSLWIQCNKCGVPFNNPNGIRLCCTSCSHLLCECCYREPCPICGKSFAKVVIDHNMPSQIKLYFEEMPRLMVLLQKIYKFQSDQRNALVTRKWGIFEKIYKAQQAKAALVKKRQLLQEEMRAILRRISNAKEFIYNFERRRAMRLEQERITQYVHRVSTARQTSELFNRNGCSTGNVVHAISNPQRFNEMPHMTSFTNRSASMNFDSGHISDFTPRTRTPAQGRQNIPSAIGGQKRRGDVEPFLNELRRRQFYGNQPQFTTPQQRCKPPKEPSYRLN